MKYEKTWDWEINSHNSWWNINFKEWWNYRHLMARLVRRDFLLKYQQTVLGPIWIFLQPILTLGIYVFVFGNIIGVSTGTVPPALFYLCGIILWNFFSETFVDTAFTFTHNAYIFSKVYFPRLIIPISVIASKLLRFSGQLVLLGIMLAYYWIVNDVPIRINAWILLLPVLLLILALIGFSIGIIFSVFTGKYRDLANFVNLGVRLLMFVTPVIYPLSVIPPKMQWVAELNPLAPLFEAFRYMVFSDGSFTFSSLMYSSLFMLVSLVAGLSIFSRQGETLIDVL